MLETKSIFGFDSKKEDSKIWILPIPWDASTSYHRGASLGPEAVLEASSQIDFFDADFGAISELGIYMEPISESLVELNKKALSFEKIEDFNSYSEQLNHWIYKQVESNYSKNRISAVLGGDHSVPYSHIKFVAQKHGLDYGILHIDAHFDLREAYLDMEHSHASIMYNVMKSDFAPKKLVQVGLRDFCQEELNMAKNDSRIEYYLDQEIQKAKISGNNWKSICKKIISDLPKNVYISMDIDGLDPVLCPGTGTPVPGGLSFQEFNQLVAEVTRSGRKIIGFDLDEVAPAEGDREWNGNVGMRVLAKLCGWSAVSQGWLKELESKTL